MAELPQSMIDSPIAVAIFEKYKSVREDPRRYLGASIIGHACSRALWYEFRWCGREEFDGRMLRLFQTGHREEARLIEELRGIGCQVWDRQEGTDEQIGIVALSGHFRGHLDGVITGVPDAPKTPHVLECKTHNKRLYDALCEHGVEKSKPTHWAQMQIYMHFMELERALYVGTCKDDDRIYSERVRYDKAAAENLVARAKSIITAERPPERIGANRDDFHCRWCSHIDRCHGPVAPVAGVPVVVTCRSCVHATPIINESNLGSWKCEKHNKLLDEAEQRRGCDDHLFIPDLITFAEYQDAGKSPDGDWIEYRNKDGDTWKNGKAGNQYRSVELTILPAPLVGPTSPEVLSVDQVKQHLGGEVVEVK